MPLRGAMPTWTLTPFAAAPSWVGFWYVHGDPMRFSSPAFGAAKQLAPMPVWGVVLLAIAAWIWVGIWLHRDAAHDDQGRLSLPRTLTLALGLSAGCVFVSWWATVGAFQAVRNPAATPTGIGWLGLVAFVYLLAALRVASGRAV